MRHHSVFEIDCICGRRLESQTPAGSCACGRAWRVEWPADHTEPRVEEPVYADQA